MRKCLLLAIVLFTLGVGCVAAQSASVTFDKNTDFYKYKTYKWVSIKDASPVEELTADQLVGTVEAALAKKGLTKSNADNVDLLIGYQVAKNGDKHLNHYAVGSAYGSAAGATSATGGATTTSVHSGQLVLDMYDSGKKQLVWRGVVSDAIDPNDKPEKKQKRMDKAVEKLLKDYPPQK
jgi:uncharacterized protein DUF4136